MHNCNSLACLGSSAGGPSLSLSQIPRKQGFLRRGLFYTIQSCIQTLGFQVLDTSIGQKDKIREPSEIVT